MKIISKITRDVENSDNYVLGHINDDVDITEIVVELFFCDRIRMDMQGDSKKIIRFSNKNGFIWISDLYGRRRFRVNYQNILEKEYQIILKKENRINKLNSL